MTLLKSATFAAALVAVTTIGMSAASAASFVDCMQAAKQASAALDANQQSPNYDNAKRAASDAQSFCSHGLYQQGIDRYAQVTKQLGGSNG